MQRKILIVDDDEDLSFIISEMLENHGYRVAASEAARRLLRSFLRISGI